VRLPSLAERADDLHGLVNFELSRAAAALGLSELGIERPALATLLERAFVANEAELRAIVLGLAASADAPLITLAVLRRVLDGSRGARPDEPGVEGTSSRERARSRLAPRSRRA
jgi:DNA-binding NtrC family response regulator